MEIKKLLRLFNFVRRKHYIPFIKKKNKKDNLKPFIDLKTVSLILFARSGSDGKNCDATYA